MAESIYAITNKLLTQAEGMAYVGRTASTEGFTDVVKDLAGVFVTKLKNVLSVFTSNQNRDGGLDLDKKELNAFARDLVNLRYKVKDMVEKYDYTTLSYYNLPTVPGIKVTYLEASKLLIKVFKTYRSELLVTLDDLDTTVSKVLSDKAYLMSSRPVRANVDMVKLYDNLHRDLNSVLDPKKLADRDKFKNMFPNVKSLYDTFENLVSITEGTNLDEILKIKKFGEEIEEKIKNLIVEIENNRVEVSKSVLEKLSSDLEYSAKNITLIFSFVVLYNKMVNVIRVITEEEFFNGKF